MNRSSMTQDMLAPEGLRIPPNWRIVPPGVTPPDGIPLIVAPGPGFGSGAHPTTQLCLRAVHAFSPKHGRPWRMLDFGSGSGILSLAAARLGATVEAVEIDEAAIAHAHTNLALNDLADRVHIGRDLDAAVGPYDLVVANILRPVLLAFADALTARLAPGGALVLSGLVATDVPELSVRYGALLGDRRPDVFSVGEWRAMAWKGQGL